MGSVVSENELALLLRATHFAAEKHRHQRRKDADASPYVNHPIEVAQVLASVGQVGDVTTLVAAVLHDTIEDTETKAEEIEELFGAEVRTLVEEVTDDKRLPKTERKRLQVEHASQASCRAKMIKMADKLCNVLDVTLRPPADWSSERRREYLDWSDRVVAGCRGCNEPLEQKYDEVRRKGGGASGGG